MRSFVSGRPIVDATEGTRDRSPTRSPSSSIIAAPHFDRKVSLAATHQPSADQAAAAASSNCCSSHGDMALTPATTFCAHSMYSKRLLTEQLAAGLDAMVRRLLVLSASLISLAWFDPVL